MTRLLCLSLSAALVAACNPIAPALEENPAAAAVTATAPTRIDLGTLPGDNSSLAIHVNDAGVVVGQSYDASGRIRAFRWSASAGMTELQGLPHAVHVGVTSILATGEILGWNILMEGAQVPVMWDAQGRVALLRTPGRPLHTPISFTDINARGEMIGTRGGSAPGAFFWSKGKGWVNLSERIANGTFVSPEELNSSGTVVGSFWDLGADLPHAFIWPRGGPLLDLGGGAGPYGWFARAYTVNNLGVVGGAISLSDSVGPTAFLWTRRGGYVMLPSLPARTAWSYVRDLNDAGVAVGASDDPSSGGLQPVAWLSPTSLIRLNGTDVGMGEAVAINARGLVAGYAWIGTSTPFHAYVWSIAGVVPSSATVASAPPAGRPAGVGTGAMGCLTERVVPGSRMALTPCLQRR